MIVSPDEKKPICGDNIWLRKVECGILHAVTWSSRTQQWCCWSILEPYTARLWAWVKKDLISKIIDNVFVTITVCADSYYECFYWSELQYRIQAHRKMGDRFFGHL